MVARTFKRGGRAVDELAVRAGAGERAFEDELIVFTRFQAVFFEKSFQRRAERWIDIEDGLDGTTFLAAADEARGRRVRQGRG